MGQNAPPSMARKRILLLGATIAAIVIFALLVLLGALSRRGSAPRDGAAEATTDLQGIERGITADGFPYEGSTEAPVTIVEYSDYLCGHCRDYVLDTEPLIQQEYIATGKVQYIVHYYVLGQAQVLLAEASHCAADQGRFWEYHRTMFENQSRFSSISTLDELWELLAELAAQVDLDLTDFETCWQSHEHQEAIIRAVQAARELGVGGTPTFDIQGEFLVGNQPYDVFQQAIEEALARAGS